MGSNSRQVGENILIVDDTLENLLSLSTTLSENGYTVQSVVSGSMALTAASRILPDLILLDIKMPDMDGYEVCKLLKQSEITSDIPIIFLSGLHNVSEKIKAFKLGGADYITKPFQVEEVLARVKHQLTIQKLSRQIKQQNQLLQHEITERRKAELEALTASQAKSNFLANMSHELRTPLNAIIGFSKLMSHDSLLNVEQQENIRIINRSAEHLLELINDVLEFSKIEAGVISFDKTNFDLYRLLDNIEEMFQIKVEQRNIKLNFIVTPDVPQYIKTDIKKLRSCLTNLIANAIKFTPQGNVTLKVSSPSPPHLLFQVEDTGCGISPDELDRLFDAFTQAEAGKTSSKGTGLGLAITRKFVQMMGGEIKVTSTVGKGSVFAFDIQVDIANDRVNIRSPQITGLKPNQAKFKILVVDDSEENRLLLVKLLNKIGFAVSSAENGQVALEVWETFQPDLILMDTRMPVMDGYSATQRLRNLNQNLTASNFGSTKNEIEQAGFDDVIRKPVLPEILLHKIAEYLSVSYIYDRVPSLRSISVSENSLLEESIAMPRSWLTQLHQAANEVNEDLLQSPIQEIPENKASLSDLTMLVKNFRQDIILVFTQKIFDD
ncbi:MAG: response regulator [Rivularia sp. (in: cyanobacteria)]